MPKNPRWNSQNAHSDEAKDKALQLRRKGTKFKDIAEELNIPVQTVRSWNMDAQLRDENSTFIKDDREIQRLKHQEDRVTNARYWQDPSVELYGDPPLHRSALARKLQEQNSQ